jgi:regulation of enolase protein 1 (concanavalin A-like superfamily)
MPVMIETSFTVSPKAQFDPAGILFRLDADHWIKTEIEVVDGTPRLSCIVTNSFSDWSTQNWPEPQVDMRVHILPQHGGSFAIEATPFDSQKWSLFRIAHMNKDMRHSYLNDHPTVQNAHRGENAPPDCLLVGVLRRARWSRLEW